MQRFKPTPSGGSSSSKRIAGFCLVFFAACGGTKAMSHAASNAALANTPDHADNASVSVPSATATNAQSPSIENRCIPEDTAAFCARAGKTCGEASAADNCGVSRTARCGDACVKREAVIQVSTGDSHTCAIRGDFALKCWGRNQEYQLGYLFDLQTTPEYKVDLGTGHTALSVSAGVSHTCAILDDKSLKCWGNNDYGQLGRGNTDSIRTAKEPVNLGLGRTAQSVIAADRFSCALLDDSSVKCWGLNSSGTLGLAHNTRQNAPTNAVDFGKGRLAKSIAAGSNHVCAILDDQSLTCWGGNSYGVRGVGHTKDSNVPEPVNLGAGRFATSIAAGASHMCAILDDDSLKCWGWNYAGQLGVKGTIDIDKPSATVNLGPGRKAKFVAAGGSHTCAILDDASVRCWGLNTFGQLGLGHNKHADEPTQAVDLGPGRTAKSLALGRDYSCAIRDDDSLTCWGLNSNGQLGIGQIPTKTNAPTNAVMITMHE